MINHANCSHESSSSARAKCRRAIKSGNAPVPAASEKTVDFSKGGNAKSSTPRDKDMQCDVCGVERIEFRGTDSLTSVILSVGAKCLYMIKDSEDLVELP